MIALKYAFCSIRFGVYNRQTFIYNIFLYIKKSSYQLIYIPNKNTIFVYYNLTETVMQAIQNEKTLDNFCLSISHSNISLVVSGNANTFFKKELNYRKRLYFDLLSTNNLFNLPQLLLQF